MGKGSGDQTALMHVYAQPLWHFDAYIVGNAEALQALKQAIDEALKHGRSKMITFAGDGEEYDVMVIMLEDREKWDRLAEPYTEDYARERREDALWPCELIGGGME